MTSEKVSTLFLMFVLTEIKIVEEPDTIPFCLRQQTCFEYFIGQSSKMYLTQRNLEGKNSPERLRKTLKIQPSSGSTYTQLS